LYEEGLSKVGVPLYFYLVLGRLDQMQEMEQKLRQFDGIGSLYFDFEA
jgi:hypothetical protein